MKSLAVLVMLVVVGSSTARADVPIHRISQDDGTIVADTPALTRAINESFRATKAEYGNRWDCTFTETTSVVVSWECSGTVDNGPNSGGSFHASAMEAYTIDGGKLVALDWKKLWASNAATKLGKLKGLTARDEACTITGPVSKFVVTNGGIAAEIDDISGRTCELGWADIAPLLVPGSPLALLAAAESATSIDNPMPGPTGSAAPAKTDPKRFVAEGTDGVRDTTTGLVWAARDNGKDLNAAAATAYAKAYRGGGKADWRLPTIDELAAISAPDLSHKDKTDCTKGKNGLLISPLIHISCGLAWSSTTSGKTRSAFGFITGTPRVSAPTAKKNYRALPVRKD